MINNINNVDTHVQSQMSIAKATQSHMSLPMPPVLGFKANILKKEKAIIKIKKFKRADNIIIAGTIDEDYVDIIEEDIEKESDNSPNFFQLVKPKRRIQYLKNCYIIDYIQAPQPKRGMGTEAIKQLAEKAMFDSKADGRIVTFSAPVWKESSPALFFYKLGFRFMNPEANDYMEVCLAKKIPDIPPQTGMMFLPKSNLHKLLRYGELF